MPKRTKPSRLLVIDASVARSAGGVEAIDPVSKSCRDSLETIRKVCHRMVMTPEIKNEWDRHQSRFAREWRYWMVSRKKVVYLTPTPDPELYDVIGQIITPEQQATILKDIRLVEAALSSDEIILSLDEVVRKLFIVVAQNMDKIAELTWINPGKVEETCIPWLQQGAPPEQHRQIGFKPANTP